MHQSERQQSKATVAVARSRWRSGSVRRGWSQLRPTPNDKKEKEEKKKSPLALSHSFTAAQQLSLFISQPSILSVFAHERV